MALVQPFKGTRYNPNAVGDISGVVAPPYDVISGKERERLASLSPYNVVHLTLPESRAGLDRFQASAALIDEWIKERILVRDDEPGIYVYRHEFEFEGRSFARAGFIAALDLEEGGVSGHERTVSIPKADRMKLLGATRSSLGPIFMLCPDPDSDVRRLIEGAMTEEIAEVDVGGGRHILTKIADTSVHGQLSNLLEPRRFLIADGHHRYGAALANYRSAKEDGTEGKWCRFTMVFCVAMEAPGLLILPTHRLVTSPRVAPKGYLRALQQSTHVEAVARLEDMLAGMARAGKGTFGLCLGRGGAFYLVRVVCQADGEDALDVEILHKILETSFDGPQGLHLAYTHSAREGVDRVAAGEASMCFFLQPVSTEELVQFSEAGRLMPPKTTYFHPKPLTGLVMNIAG